jgi:Large eukaryotic DNA virus major capsid protein/Major capsid protein N-terminus
MNKPPSGQITTLLDLTPRDIQDNAYFPLKTDTSWFSRDSDRRTTPFVPILQEFQLRGPAEFGQRFTFDIASQTSGDLLLGASLQLQLTSWFDITTVLNLQSGNYTYSNAQTAWQYANALGAILIQSAELEVDGDTIEQIDGDFTYVCQLFTDANMQFGLASDHIASTHIPNLLTWPSYRVFPTEDGYIHCILPFFFQRGFSQLKESLPLISCREGTVRINITLRPFNEVIRQVRGYRDSCTSTPLNQIINILKVSPPFNKVIPTQTSITAPLLENVRLLTMGAILDGNVRTAMLRQPYEILHREVQIFPFEEPLKYVITKSSSSSIIRVQLPIEANHPIEELIWFIRRKDVANNNEWTNYSSVIESSYDPIFSPPQSLLISAAIQANGITLVEAEEQYFRTMIAKHHKSGQTSASSFIYGYPFGRTLGDHQPSGTMNASRLQNLRLVLDIRPPTGGVAWEVKVFSINLNWLRFQNGILNKVFTD